MKRSGWPSSLAQRELVFADESPIWPSLDPAIQQQIIELLARRLVHDLTFPNTSTASSEKETGT
jgi:hypothetical protein